jgi:GNAT superfamily N-acetyltransferase
MAGTPRQFKAFMVQAIDMPAEPQGFGSDPRILWKLLKLVEGWECVLVDTEIAVPLGELVERESKVPVRYLDGIHHLLAKPVVTFEDKSVRLLNKADIGLLNDIPYEFTTGFWGSVQAALEHGLMVGAVIDDRVVATALAGAYSDKYAEIGVYTHPDFRSRGLVTAASSLLVKHIQASGWIPSWSTGENNIPSLRVTRKLGFVPVSKQKYVIGDQGKNK